MLQKQEFETSTPYDNFLFGLKAKETKRQYPHRLDKFLSYLELEGTIEEKCTQLHEIGKDVNVLHSQLMRFISIQKQRIEDKEISEGTLCNYIKAVKLDPQNSIYWYNKGYALSNLGKQEPADLCFQKAVELDPNLN